MTPGDVMLWCLTVVVCAGSAMFLLALTVATVVGIVAMVRKPKDPNDLSTRG